MTDAYALIWHRASHGDSRRLVMVVEGADCRARAEGWVASHAKDDDSHQIDYVGEEMIALMCGLTGERSA